jgi:WhiB family redox-sensing transcriptional regulator
MSITETMDIIAADSGGWIRQALCGSGEWDPDLWFPERHDSPVKAAQAIRVCKRCPVRMQCLADSLERKDIRGIRGGLSGNRRSRMLRRRREKAQSA